MLTQSSYNDLKCIWMNAGVVEYKLCDRNFDCEKCMFYKIMKNNFTECENKKVILWEKSINDKVKNILFNINENQADEKSLLLKNNLSVKEIKDGNYCLGFSPLLNNILDDYEIKYFSSKKHFKKNENLIDLIGEWGHISINAPVNIDEAEFITTGKQNQTWFGIIKADEKEIIKSAISASVYQNDKVYLQKEFNRLLTNLPEVGNTMFDGGFELKYIHQLLGVTKYIEILKHLLHR